MQVNDARLTLKTDWSVFLRSVHLSCGPLAGLRFYEEVGPLSSYGTGMA